MQNKKIYISPSNQAGNRYVIGNTNEKEQMEQLARLVADSLNNRFEAEARVATLTKRIEARCKEAKEEKADIYISLHSNAGPKGANASGASAYYHPARSGSKDLASRLVHTLDQLCPIPSNRRVQVLNGMAYAEGRGLAEIRIPSENNQIPVLVEVNFHDNPETAAWMIEHREEIAEQLVNSIAGTFNLVEKVRKHYRVQVGVFLKKENAEKLKEKLKSAGFEAIIKYY